MVEGIEWEGLGTAQRGGRCQGVGVREGDGRRGAGDRTADGFDGFGENVFGRGLARGTGFEFGRGTGKGRLRDAEGSGGGEVIGKDGEVIDGMHAVREIVAFLHADGN